MLFIANDTSTACAKQGNSRTVKSSKAVSRSLEQYFSGKKVEIGILYAAFSNGHIHFCGHREVEEVYRTLMKLKEKGVATNQSHLDDFIHKIKSIMER